MNSALVMKKIVIQRECFSTGGTGKDTRDIL